METVEYECIQRSSILEMVTFNIDLKNFWVQSVVLFDHLDPETHQTSDGYWQ